MNLVAYTSGAIDAVNPRRPLTWQESTGFTTSPDGTQVPTYNAPVTLLGQIQPITWKDLQQLDALNVQGTRRKIYLYGVKQGVVRSLEKGGDLLTDEAANVWLVAQVMEQFSDEWCSVAATLQTEGS